MPQTAKISYDYPVGGLDPFDVTESRTQHLYFASGWARAWAADEPLPAQPVNIMDAIPVGYKALSTIEKLAVVADGEVLRQWPATDTFDEPFRRNLSPVLRAEPSGARQSWPYDYWLMSTTRAWYGFDDYATALATAIHRTGDTWLVGRPLRHDSWP
jgi:hypothetical protein